MSFAVNRDLLTGELCKRSFARFVQEFWDTVVSEPLVWNWHMAVFCTELQAVATRVFGEKVYNKYGKLEFTRRLIKKYDLLTNVPPGTSKSLIFSVFFHPWCWANDPTLKFISGSYSSVLSLEHSDLSRDVLKSEKYQLMYPGIKIRRDKDNKGLYTNDHKGGRFTTSVGGTITGFHAHFILIDDPINPKQASSAPMLKAASDWVSQTMSTRKIDKAVTPTIVVMQRLHEKDPAGVMLAKKKKVRHINLPGEIWDIKTKESVKPPCLVHCYTNGVLDPLRMGKQVLIDMKADLGQYGYAGQILQNPSPPSGGMFKMNKIEILDSIPAVNIVETIRYWDKAGTSKEDNPGSAHTAGVKIAKLKDSKWLYAILDVVDGQWESLEREQNMKQIAQLDGKGVKVWMEQEPGSGGKESAQASVRNLAGFAVHIDRVTGDKVTRADPFSVQVNWGHVCMIRAPWNEAFLEQGRLFPFGRLKDQIDAAAGGFNKLTNTKKAGAW